MLNGSVLCHRGIWNTKQEQNTMNALVSSVENGFGIETDLRTINGEIVLSHDTIVNNQFTDFKKFLESVENNENFKKVYYALNIKEDGLEQKLLELLKEFKISERCFVFDMSIPSMIVFRAKKKELNSEVLIATRESEFENCTFYSDSKVVWMDEFEKDWINRERIQKHLDNGNIPAIVSRELHNREIEPLWEICIPLIQENPKILMCTDEPFDFLKKLKGE